MVKMPFFHSRSLGQDNKLQLKLLSGAFYGFQIMPLTGPIYVRVQFTPIQNSLLSSLP